MEEHGQGQIMRREESNLEGQNARTTTLASTSASSESRDTIQTNDDTEGTSLYHNNDTNLSLTVTSPEGHTIDTGPDDMVLQITTHRYRFFCSRREIKQCFPRLDACISQFLNKVVPCEDWVIFENNMNDFNPSSRSKLEVILLKEPKAFEMILSYHHGRPLQSLLQESEPWMASFLWTEAMVYGNIDLANHIFVMTR